MRLMSRRTSLKHEKLLSNLKEKSQIKVIFIVIHRSVWKTDAVFQAMQADPLFEPRILIVPTLGRDLAWARAEFQQAEAFFNQKKYPVSSVSPEDNVETAITVLRDLNADIVFFTNQNNLTFTTFYDYVLGHYLTCYVPYAINVSRLNNYQANYNMPFHNLVWRIFIPHSVANKNYRRVQAIHGRNVTVTGYSALEALVTEDRERVDQWKPLGLKRVIWAPHHTVDMPALPYANFLRYADYFLELVEKYSGRVQWCFKPHPLLKPKLLKHPDWGLQRTEKYFNFWLSRPHTQLELGQYANLFRNSDAMIHDSGSFLAEYLYVNKPVLYLWSSPGVTTFFNEFGLEALAACERADTEDDICEFIEDLIADKDVGHGKRRVFLNNHPVAINGTLPSERILQELKRTLHAHA